jgi:membrane-associated phospholipid phosphatase
MRRGALLMLSAAVAAPLPAAAEPPRELQLDLPATLAITGAAAGATLLGVALQSRLVAPRCRVCEPDPLDRWARTELRWSNTGRAALLSDGLLVAVPVAAGGALLWSAWDAGGRRTAMEDLLIAGEAVSVALLATQVAKLAVGRARPYAWADPAAADSGNANLSFWSGHTATTFAVASAAGTVARLCGYRSWPWILGAGLAGASACGWLRIAADRHWTTDVLVGAAVGSAAGFGMPLLLHGRRGEPSSRLRITPLPIGIAGEV